MCSPQLLQGNGVPRPGSAIALFAENLFCDSKTDEHDLSCYALFQQYLKLYESTLEDFLLETGKYHLDTSS